jgi:hypothetical protein
MVQKEWMTSPMLHCVSLDDTLAFWGILGYKTTYYQNRPYKYGMVERGGYALHFFYEKAYVPGQFYSACLVAVKDAAATYAEFTNNIRQHTGRAPAHSGLPRISKMKPGQTRFTVTDPSGNAVYFVSMGEEDQEAFEEADAAGLTPLQKATALAIRLRDFKEDPAAATKVLDTGLKKASAETAYDMAQALWVRGELAADAGAENIYFPQLKSLRLTKEEIEQLKKKLHITTAITHFFAD